MHGSLVLRAIQHTAYIPETKGLSRTTCIIYPWNKDLYNNKKRFLVKYRIHLCKIFLYYRHMWKELNTYNINNAVIFLLRKPVVKKRINTFVFVLSERWDFIDTTGEQKIFKIRQVHVRSQVFQKVSKFANWKTDWPKGNNHTHIHTFIWNTTIQKKTDNYHQVNTCKWDFELQKLLKLCTCIHSTNCAFTKIDTGFFCWTSVHVTTSLT